MDANFIWIIVLISRLTEYTLSKWHGHTNVDKWYQISNTRYTFAKNFLQ